MLIIEGTDTLGKTTLARALQKKIMEIGEDCPYSHYGVRPRNFDFYHGYLKRIQPWMICDRFHYSEYAYEKAQEKNPRYSVEGFEIICGTVLANGGFTVVLVSTTDFIMTQLTRAKDDKMSNAIVCKANTFYKQLIQTHPPDCKFIIEIDEKHRAAEDEELVQKIANEYIMRQMFLQSRNR